MSLSRREPHSSRQSRRHQSAQSCAPWRTTRLAAALSQVCRDRAATSLAYRSSRPILLANALNCSARLSPTSAGWRSWPMSAILAPCLNWPRFGRPPARSALRSLRSRRGVSRQDFAWGEARRHPRRTADQIRSCNQSDHGEGAWPRNPADAARPRRRGDRMIGRREFITLIGSAAAWPLTARAQQADRMRRIGVLMPSAADDPEYQARLTAFLQRLAQLGWLDGRNVRIDYRWGDGKPDTMRKYAAELVALAPEVILASSSVALAPLLEATRTVPTVFAGVGDPVAAGYVKSLARPGGNATGFLVYEYGIGAKWLELLKEVAPRVTRVAVFRDSSVAAGPGLFGAIQALAPSLGVELRPVDVRDAGEIERAVAAFAQAPGGGLIVGGRATIHRGVIIALAAKHRLPAVYTLRYLLAAPPLL